MLISRRSFLTSASLSALSIGLGGAFHGSSGTGGASVTFNVALVGGGYVRRASMHPDGTFFAGVDVFGLYSRTTVPNQQWTQTYTATAMAGPYSTATTPSPYLGGGCWDICIDPNNSSTIYSATGVSGRTLTQLFKSTNGGATWSTTGSGLSASDPNDQSTPGKQMIQKIAVDPFNSNNIWYSTSSNTLFSSDGGTTFTTCTNINGGAARSGGILFDPNTQNRMLIGVNGSGVYVTTNANLGASATFTNITSSATDPGPAQMGSDSNYYFSNQAASGVWRVSPTNVLTQIFTGGVYAIGIDPHNPGRMVLTNNGTPQFCTSAVNSGTPSWTGNVTGVTYNLADQPWLATARTAGYGGGLADSPLFFDPWSATSANTQTIASSGTLTITDAPAGESRIYVGRLMRVTNTGVLTNYMLGTVASYSGTTLTLTLGVNEGNCYLGAASGGSGTFSAWTLTFESVWQCEGTGVVRIENQKGSPSYTYTLEGETLGMESEVTTDLCKVSGEPLLSACSDNAFTQFVSNPINATAGPTGFGPDYSGLKEGTRLGIAYATTPAFVAGINFGSTVWENASNGAVGSWSTSAASPAGSQVAVSCGSSNIILVGANLAVGHYSQDGGTTWTACPSPWPNLSAQGAYQNEAPIYQQCMDKVASSPWIAYAVVDQIHCYQLSIPASGAATATLVYSSLSGGGGFQKIDSVPGNQGHVFWTGGPSGGTWTSVASVLSSHPSSTSLFMSSNGGSAWTAMPNLKECWTFGFGAPKAGGNGYPSIYVAAWVDQGSGYIWGYYRIDNFDPLNIAATTYTLIGHYVRDWLDSPTCMCADPDQWGRVFVGHQGSTIGGFQVTGQTNAWP